MVLTPDAMAARYVEAGCERLIVHAESVVHLHRTLQLVRSLGATAAVALNPATPAVAVAQRPRPGRHGAGDDGQPGLRRAGLHRHDGAEDRARCAAMVDDVRAGRRRRGRRRHHAGHRGGRGPAPAPTCSSPAPALFKDPAGLAHAVTELRATAEAAQAGRRLGSRLSPGTPRTPSVRSLACPSTSSPSPTALRPTRLWRATSPWRRRAIRCAPVTRRRALQPRRCGGSPSPGRGRRADRRHVPHRLPAGRAARRRRASPPRAAGRCRTRCSWSPSRRSCNAAPGVVRGRCATTRPRRRRWSPPTSSWPTSRRPRWPRLAGASPSGRHVVDIHQRVKARLAEWYDEADLVDAATDELARQHPVAGGLGNVLVFLPQELSQRTARAPRRRWPTGPRSPSLAGLTGVADADAGVLRSLAWFGWSGDARAARTHDGARPAARRRQRDLRVISASDSDEEVRAAVRGWSSAWPEPARRSSASPSSTAGDAHHAALIHHHLDAAELPWNGAGQDRLADTVAGRTLLRILALADGPPLRHHVFGVLAGAPVRQPDGRRSCPRRRLGAPLARGRRRRHDAAPSGTTASPALAAAKEGEAEARLADDREAAARRLRRDAEQALELRDFVLGLLERLDAVAALTHVATSWPPRPHGLLDGYLGDDAGPGRVADRRAGRRRPGGRRHRPPRPARRRGPRRQPRPLRPRPGPRAATPTSAAAGRFGDGVLVGPLGAGPRPRPRRRRRRRPGRRRPAHPAPGRPPPARPRPGQAVAAELPRRRRSPAPRAPPAPRRRRRRAHGRAHLPPRRPAPHHRARRVAVAARPHRRPHGAVAGGRTSCSRRQEPWLTHVPSFAGGRDGSGRLGAGHRAARPPRQRRRRPPPPRRHSATTLARRLLDARVQPGFTPYDGNLAGTPHPVAGRQRPGRVADPARVVVGLPVRLLRALPARRRARREPGGARPPAARSSRDRSSTRCSSGTSPSASTKARPAGRPTSTPLRRHIELAFGQAERRGVTGRPLLWRLQQTELGPRPRRPSPTTTPTAAGTERLEPLAAELRFGFSDEPAEVDAGRRPHAAVPGQHRPRRPGRRRAARRHRLQVLDRPASTTGLTQENPTASGTLLQLPIYAVAARDRVRRTIASPSPSAPATPSPSPIATAGCPAPKELEVDERAARRLADALRRASWTASSRATSPPVPVTTEPLRRLRRLPGVRSRRPRHRRPRPALGAAAPGARARRLPPAPRAGRRRGDDDGRRRVAADG